MAGIPLLEPSLSGNESRYLQECVDSGFVSSVGPFVDLFEQEFTQRLGSSHAVAVASGTAALHLALRAVGVGPGDVVLVSDCSFIASANPVRYCGAEPMFIDVEADTWHMDPALLEHALAELAAEGLRPAALVLVHLYGHAADAGPILDLCTQHDIPVVEDATEGLGAHYTEAYGHPACRGKAVGTVGTVGCFSFNGNKMITAGGGGMIVTDDQALADQMRHWSTQAKQPGPGYEHDDLGYNYRLTNIAAAVGLAQLERLDDFLTAKRRITAAYGSAISHGVFQRGAVGSRSSGWLPALTLDERDPVLHQALASGIGCRPVWPALSRQKPYLSCRSWRSGVADDLARRGLCLPASVGLAADGSGETGIEALAERIDTIMTSVPSGARHAG
jgi:dTDP-4-amino-4,6-dideoxygalactose transaminase